MAKESSQHKGHRQRMRARVEQYGLESLEPHEALEYVLYITNTRKDTNGLAHVLMDRFGDFAGVLDASEEDLLTVEGVGPSTARMLHLLPQVGRYYTQCAVNGKKCMKTTDQLVEYLMAQFAGTVQERALLTALDGRSRIKGLFWLRDGTSDRVSLEIKDVVAAALKGGTDSVVLCHNHPNGVALPSREDLMATENIVRALGLVKVHLRDHIILTESEYFSMREANRLPFYDFQTGEMPGSTFIGFCGSVNTFWRSPNTGSASAYPISSRTMMEPYFMVNRESSACCIYLSPCAIFARFTIDG